MKTDVIHVNDANFESEVIKAQLPVLVDFSANWCGPSRALAPIIEKIADEYVGKAKIAKLDVDESQQTAQKYSIFSVPTILLFKEGNVVGQSVGLVPKEKIQDLLDKALR